MTAIADVLQTLGLDALGAVKLATCLSKRRRRNTHVLNYMDVALWSRRQTITNNFTYMAYGHLT